MSLVRGLGIWSYDPGQMNDLIADKLAKRSPRQRFFDRYKTEVDEYGFHPATHQIVERCTHFLYEKWFGVQIAGLENVPSQGSSLLFGNHSGGIPVDGFLFYDGIINFHPRPRRVRFVVTKFLLKAPIVGKTLRAFGAIDAKFDIATKLLNDKQLVFFYPEAEKGTGKLFKDRYKLVEFHTGFVRAAVKTGAPLIPIVTIGGDEIYPMLANFKFLAKLLDAPYFPVTPFFPWMPFPLNFIPIPIRIMVAVWPAFKLKYPPEAADDKELMQQVASDIRADIQTKVNALLAMRKNPFARWDMTKVQAYLSETKHCTPDVQRHLE